MTGGVPYGLAERLSGSEKVANRPISISKRDRMLTISFTIRLTKRACHLQGFLSLFWLHLRINCEQTKQSLPAAELRQQLVEKRYVLDQTKRKSLQPGNRSLMPEGWVEAPIERAISQEPERVKQRVHRPITQPLESGFTHDFFGSQLIVGDMRIGGQLTRGKHRLEITQDQLLIDNVPQTVNQGELERIKAIIRETRV